MHHLFSRRISGGFSINFSLPKSAPLRVTVMILGWYFSESFTQKQILFPITLTTASSSVNALSPYPGQPERITRQQLSRLKVKNALFFITKGILEGCFYKRLGSRFYEHPHLKSQYASNAYLTKRSTLHFAI